MQVRKKSGVYEEFDSTKIKLALIKASSELDDSVDVEDIDSMVVSVIHKLANVKNITTTMIDDLVIDQILDYGLKDLAKAYIRNSIKKEQMFTIADQMQSDWNITKNALEILKKRYLQDNETPLGMIKRVAKFFAKSKEEFNDYYNLMVGQYGLPSSPILMNAGTQLRMFSSCFTVPFEQDSLSSIFETLKKSAIITKYGGGIGYSFSNLREKDAPIRSTKGKSSGILSWIQIFSDAISQIKQGGRRRGALMGVLHILNGETHPEILDYILLKTQRSIPMFNLSVMVDNNFMHALEDNDDIKLISPTSRLEVGAIPSRKIWNCIIASAYQCGDPGLLFYDRINEDNYYSPNNEPLKMVNPCGESPLLPWENCCLGSLNLYKYESDDKLREDAATMCRLLNRTIEKTRMPYKKLQDAMLATRKIGIGVMGVADYFLKNNLVYGSDESCIELKRLLTIIKEAAVEESQHLEYPKLIDGRCNANVMAIAPTGTISTILNVSSGIEPVFAWTYEHRILDGTIQKEIDPVFRERYSDLDYATLEKLKYSIQDEDIFSKEEKQIFRTAHEISPMERLKVQQAAQDIADMGVSGTINLLENTTLEDIDKIYRDAWKMRLKGITIYRNNSKPNQPIVFSCPSGVCDL